MKKVILFLFFAVLILCLCACGANDAQEAAEPEETNTETAEETSADQITEEETETGLVEIDGNTITVRDDGSDKASKENGIEKTPLVTARDINYSCQSGPITLTVNKLQLSNICVNDDTTASMMDVTPGETCALFVVDVTVENTSDDDISIYPDQSVIVTNTKEQVNANIWVSDSVGGDYLGQVVKEGQIYFFCSGTADDITHIQWRVDAPHDASFDKVGDDIVIEIELAH